MSATAPAAPRPAWTIRRAEAATWPPGLEALETDCPEVIHGTGDRDAVAALEPASAVTIVGSRRATPAGIVLAGELAHAAAAAGLTVVSGLAYGIDAAAHRGALAAGGRTVAVMAGGPDSIHPPSSRGLAAQVVREGALVSEWPPGTAPARWRFPRRNRMMATLSALTLVVEAELPSGSMITAEVAAERNREVAAVPGSPAARTARGTNQLIKDGAHVVRDARDLLDLLLGVGAGGDGRPNAGPPLEPGLSAVLAVIEGSAGLDEIARACGLGAGDAAIALSRLELLGYVTERADGGHVRTALREAAAPIR